MAADTKCCAVPKLGVFPPVTSSQRPWGVPIPASQMEKQRLTEVTEHLPKVTQLTNWD